MIVSLVFHEPDSADDGPGETGGADRPDSFGNTTHFSFQKHSNMKTQLSGGQVFALILLPGIARLF